MANPNLGEIVTTTLRNRSKQLADNVSKGNALLARLSENGKIKYADGGRTIIQELEYAENSTFQWYSGYEALNINPSNVFDAAEFSWKQAAVNVVASGLETEIQNSGQERIINLLSSRIANAERTMKNNISVGVYSDGTGSSGKQLGGLQLLVADAPTSGVVGGIDRATYTFWQNKTYDFSAESGGTSASTGNMQAGLQAAWVKVIRGNDKPDLIPMDSNYFTMFWNSLTQIQRLSDPTTAVAGFENLKFVSADVVWDNDSGIPANHFYMLNTNYIFFRPHPSRYFSPPENKMSVNQDALVVPILFAGNLTASNCALQLVGHE
jgi:hypothetical protein